ncbi:uncharacterized protein LOC114294752 [Camellia sinensis]|uniref:uncharacterized protein LOC114294752 n=1 Tax=Camellia sinensis TaxID=4442 RepID=UPI0010357DCA|nr:uncharacterized protein LOC114294752 [Camellia sinensis]
MNFIFHDLIGKYLKVYIDDVAIKSDSFGEHLEHLQRTFQRMRTYKLKMNLLKCAFGVYAENFLGFLVHHKGIEVDANKAKAILGARPPANKKELQSFLGKVNVLRRFIANLAKKTLAFSPLVKIKSDHEFKWEVCHQEAFDLLKKYLINPLVLMPPVAGKPLKLYISAFDLSIGCLLAQENDIGHEQAIYYPSRRLNDAGTRYNSVEKLCLTLYFAAIKLRHYLLPIEVFVIAQTDVINGQSLADFLMKHPDTSVDLDLYEVNLVESEPWKSMFDGSKIDEGVGAELAIEFRIRSLLVFGDSQLVIKQLLGEFKCVSGALEEYLTEVKWLTSFFDHITFTHRFRLENKEANEMAQAASGLKIPKGAQERVRFQALNYVFMGDDLFRKAHDGLTLLCIGKLDQMKAMAEAHDGICGAHQVGDKMRWLINRFGLPQSITVDQGIVINRDEIKEFAKEYGIQILNSSPYYAPEVLWAYRNSKRNSTGTTPYELVYGHDAVLPLEVIVRSNRLAKHLDIPMDEYLEALSIELQDLE